MNDMLKTGLKLGGLAGILVLLLSVTYVISKKRY